MKDFLLVFRSDSSSAPKRTEQENKANTKLWMDWIAGIAAQNKLIDSGRPLLPTGKVVKPNNVITNGPYTEIKETIGGYTLVKAGNYEAAIELAKGCPILEDGGNVEVREIREMIGM